MPFKRTNGKSDSSFVPRKCVIGLDQSYARSGIAIAVEGKIKKITSVDFKNVKTKTAKRLLLQKKVHEALLICIGKFGVENVVVVCERIRTFTQGDELRPEVLKSHGALVAYVVDTAAQYGVEVWSADTRAWKSTILGTSRPVFEPLEGVKNPQKFGSVRKIIDLGLGETIKRPSPRTSSYIYDDDAADAGCIALYGFAIRPCLKKEY